MFDRRQKYGEKQKEIFITWKLENTHAVQQSRPSNTLHSSGGIIFQ